MCLSSHVYRVASPGGITECLVCWFLVETLLHSGEPKWSHNQPLPEQLSQVLQGFPKGEQVMAELWGTPRLLGDLTEEAAESRKCWGL